MNLVTRSPSPANEDLCAYVPSNVYFMRGCVSITWLGIHVRMMSMPICLFGLVCCYRKVFNDFTPRSCTFNSWSVLSSSSSAPPKSLLLNSSFTVSRVSYTCVIHELCGCVLYFSHVNLWFSMQFYFASIESKKLHFRRFVRGSINLWYSMWYRGHEGGSMLCFSQVLQPPLCLYHRQRASY
jgi:hypothetical protein